MVRVDRAAPLARMDRGGLSAVRVDLEGLADRVVTTEDPEARVVRPARAGLTEDPEARVGRLARVGLVVQGETLRRRLRVVPTVPAGLPDLPDRVDRVGPVGRVGQPVRHRHRLRRPAGPPARRLLPPARRPLRAHRRCPPNEVPHHRRDVSRCGPTGIEGWTARPAIRCRVSSTRPCRAATRRATPGGCVGCRRAWHPASRSRHGCRD